MFESYFNAPTSVAARSSKALPLQLFKAHSGFMQTVELAAQNIKSEDDSDGEKKPSAKGLVPRRRGKARRIRVISCWAKKDCIFGIFS